MKLLSFNNTSNELRATTIGIMDDQSVDRFAANPKYLALILVYLSNDRVRIFDRDSGIYLAEPSCDAFHDARNLQFHPKFDNLLFVEKHNAVVVCDWIADLLKRNKQTTVYHYVH